MQIVQTTSVASTASLALLAAAARLAPKPMAQIAQSAPVMPVIAQPVPRPIVVHVHAEVYAALGGFTAALSEIRELEKPPPALVTGYAYHTDATLASCYTRLHSHVKHARAHDESQKELLVQDLWSLKPTLVTITPPVYEIVNNDVLTMREPNAELNHAVKAAVRAQVPIILIEMMPLQMRRPTYRRLEQLLINKGYDVLVSTFEARSVGLCISRLRAYVLAAKCSDATEVSLNQVRRLLEKAKRLSTHWKSPSMSDIIHQRETKHLSRQNIKGDHTNDGRSR
jgi:hypothetical protein